MTTCCGDSRRARPGRRARRMMLAAGVILAVGAGISSAGIPGNDGVISGCYRKADGVVRLIDLAAGTTCKRSERALRWSHEGARGPAGATGPVGPAGAAGPPGPAGAGGGDGIATATFAITRAPLNLAFDNALTKVVSKYLSAGSWAVVATVNLSASAIAGDQVKTVRCELQNPARAVIGGASERRQIPERQQVQVSLFMNAGAVAPAGGGEVSLWCSGQGGARVDHAQVMYLKIGGFS